MKKIAPLFLALFALSVSAFAQNAPVTTAAGKTAVFTASVSVGTPPFVWTWTKDGKPWTPPVAQVVAANGMSSVVTLANLQPTDSGTYQVNVYNSAGNTNAPYEALTVTPVVTPPPPVIAPSGSSFSIQIK